MFGKDAAQLQQAKPRHFLRLASLRWDALTLTCRCLVLTRQDSFNLRLNKHDVQPMSNFLQDCGHNVVDDELLVRADPMAAAAGQDAPEAGPQCTVLAWDERMTLHAEGRHNPHPERPDRLRAVMARLLDSGLAGAEPSSRLLPPCPGGGCHGECMGWVDSSDHV